MECGGKLSKVMHDEFDTDHESKKIYSKSVLFLMKSNDNSYPSAKFINEYSDFFQNREENISPKE
jgi:hypothetical protein